MFSFFAKKLCFEVLGLKGAQIGPKLSFSKFSKNQCIKLFIILSIKLQQHEGLELTEITFFWRKNFILKFLGESQPKMRFFKFYEKSCTGVSGHETPKTSC